MLLVLVGEQVLHGLPVKGHVRQQVFHFEFEEDLEEDERRRLVGHDDRHLARSLASVDALDKKQLSERGLVDLDLVDVIKLRFFSVSILLGLLEVLILNADAPILIELALEMDVVLCLDPQVVAGAK